MNSVLAECNSGKTRVIKLEGPVGCGKSQLLEAFTESAAASGALVLRATGVAAERSLPFGVMRQLVEDKALRARPAGELRRLLDEDEAATEGRAPDLHSARVARMQRFCYAFQNITQDQLTVVAVDDLHHVDPLSMTYLLYMAGRARSTRLVLVFTEILNYRPYEPGYRTELIRQPHFQCVRVGCLERDQVHALLPGAHVDAATLDRWYDATGGNPLLLRALREDHLLTAAELEQPPAQGVFAHAVLTCVDRGGPATAQVADGLAVLGGESTLDLVGRLCGLRYLDVVQGLAGLRAAGLVDGYRYRHPASATALLHRMTPERRHDLHYRAAGLLYADGALAAVTAAHLRQAERADHPWAVRVLRDAAEDALAADRDRLALAYLELAERYCADNQRVEIQLRTAVALRRNDPRAAERVCDDLMTQLRRRRLTGQQGTALVQLLLGHQRLQDVSEAIAEFSRPASMALTGVSAGPCPDAEPRHSPPTARGTEYDDATDADEELLQRCVLTDSTLDPIIAAVKRLISAGRLDRARHWTDVFIEETKRRAAAGWYALFAGLRGFVAQLQGNLPEAAEYARLGRDRVEGQRGGLLDYGLASLQLLAQTAMGDYAAGARTLNQPTPDALLRSSYGLAYLRARGHYHLATNRPAVALEDFVAIGDRAHAWELDEPAWLPWRVDAAEALLQLDERTEAERLLTEQLTRMDDRHANQRLRGVVLRLLGATVEPADRPGFLTRSVEILQRVGDRLELARALHDLSEVCFQLGETAQATTLSRRAWQLARECAARPLCAKLRVEEDDADEWSRGADTAAPGLETAQLSDSEKRVAVLAACGHTNRDIAARLYVTVSTVEQHLTRVYRKLRIGGRDELPIELQFEAQQIV